MESAPQNQKWYQKTYTCENLVYNLPKLLWASFLILLGFFCYCIAMGLVPQAVPLKLKSVGASDTSISLIMVAIGQVLNVFLCPMVSFQSDRYRSKRWGRRVPFILFTMPMMVAAWLLFAFVDQEAGFISRVISRWVEVSPLTMVVVFMALIMVLYQTFLMYVGSVIYYIYNDTIPAQFLARFVGYINITSQAAGMVFNFFMLKHCLNHYTTLFLIVTVVYVLGVGAMCLLLKEPRFPDLTEEEKKKSSGLSGIGTFLKEGFSHPFYWYMYFGCAFLAIGGQINTYMIFLNRDCLGLTLENIGMMNGWAGMIGTVLGLLAAAFGTILIDRWHPVRVYAVGMMFFAFNALYLCRFGFLTPPPEVTFWILLIGGGALNIFAIFWTNSSMPMLMRVFPKSRFGSFCGAQAMFRSFMTVLFSILIGLFLDGLRRWFDLGDGAYRYLTYWQAFFNVLSAVCFLCMYRTWLKLGGYTGYKAPAPWRADGYEPMDVTPVIPPSRRLLQIGLVLFDLLMVASLAGALYMGGRYFQAGAKDGAVAFEGVAVPLAVAALAAWVLLRIGMMRDMRRAVKGEMPKNGIPHHGFLLFLGIRQLVLLGVCFYQAWVLCAPQYGRTAAWFWSAESVLQILLIGAFWIYCRIERGSSNELQ